MKKAQSTYGTYLLIYDKVTPEGTDYAYRKLVDIKDFGDFGSSPNMIEVGTLSEDTEVNIAGRKTLGDGISFTINATKEIMAELETMEDSKEIFEFAVIFPNTPLAKVDLSDISNQWAKYFIGQISIVMPGKGVDEALEGTLTVYPVIIDGVNEKVFQSKPLTKHLHEVAASTLSLYSTRK